MSKIIGITLALVAMIFTTSAEARSHRHVRHVQHYSHQRVAKVAKAAPVQQAQPDLFKMPLFGDIANYGPTPTYRKVAERAQRSERRRMVMTVNPRESYEQTRPQIAFTSAPVVSSEGGARPSDCYGIQWCGCYMRHLTGLSDRSLNLARNWANVGSPGSSSAGNIVVWRHHVGKLMSAPDNRGYADVLSGNNGSGNRATVRHQYVGNAIAFRAL